MYLDSYYLKLRIIKQTQDSRFTINPIDIPLERKFKKKIAQYTLKSYIYIYISDIHNSKMVLQEL